jgi:hypothetical protein
MTKVYDGGGGSRQRSRNKPSCLVITTDPCTGMAGREEGNGEGEGGGEKEHGGRQP